MDPIEYWNGRAGDRWVRGQDTLDAMLLPYGEAALDAGRVQEGHAVLDVGCGCGTTSLALAERVGPRGRVVGLDVSAPMLARARETGRGRSNLTFIEADASRAPIEDGAFDVVFSRFGVMFFPEPAEAFARLRRALRPAGRVAFVCWRPLDENPWARVPAEAAARALAVVEPPADPEAPGPFSFGDRARVQRILEGAGFQGLTLKPFDRVNHFGGSGSVGETAAECASLGLAARLLVGKNDAEVRRAIAAIEGAIEPFMVPSGGASFRAAAWIVSGSAAT